MLLALMLVAATLARAQDTSVDTSDQGSPTPPLSAPAPPLSVRVRTDTAEIWTPFGFAPVDQAGAGRRGYVLAAESAEVSETGKHQFSIHAVAANNFYHEETRDFLITQRFETHTVALDYRRGFKLSRGPRFELGGQLQLHETDRGVLNGFIAGVENFWVSLTGYEASKNLLRTGNTTPQGTVITRNGSVIYREAGTRSGFGDVFLTAKAALLDHDPASRKPQISARFGVNLAGRSPFTAGNFAGAGLSLDTKVSDRIAFHLDGRVTRILDGVSIWSLPVKGATYGFPIGPEFPLPKHSSLTLQIDGSSSPYLPTSTLAFDRGYGDLTAAVGHRYRSGGRNLVAQLYIRENMNLPFRVRWNTDPDMSLGLKVSVR